MRIIVTRPKEDAAPLIRELANIGVDAIAAPLFDIRLLPNPNLPKKPWQAILVTSANGIRALVHAVGTQALRKVPVLAVGEATARQANEAGFHNVVSAKGDLTALCKLAVEQLTPQKGPLLYAAGKTVSGDLKALLEAENFSVWKTILYEAIPLALPSNVISALAEGSADAVALFSKRAAKLWVEEIRKTDMCENAEKLPHLCLSPAIVDMIDSQWPGGGAELDLRSATTPDMGGFSTLLLELTGR